MSTNDEKERDALSIAQFNVPYDATINEAVEIGWNASRKHRDAEIANQLEEWARTANLDTIDAGLMSHYIKQLREGTK